MDNLNLFDAEYKFMCIVWECEPVNSTELTRLCLNNSVGRNPLHTQ